MKYMSFDKYKELKESYPQLGRDIENRSGFQNQDGSHVGTTNIADPDRWNRQNQKQSQLLQQQQHDRQSKFDQKVKMAQGLGLRDITRWADAQDDASLRDAIELLQLELDGRSQR